MRPPEVAQQLFAPLAPSYERWASILSMGQDRRWRRAMVDGLRQRGSGRVADVAAGTGSITRLLEARGWEVTPVDQSAAMLRHLRGSGSPVVAAAERLPFPDGALDGLTAGYLLRYVDDVPACLAELARVLAPGGRLGMVEFGRPRGLWRPAWVAYTRVVLPVSGRLIGNGWREVGAFLGRSIDEFVDRWPLDELTSAMETAGFDEVTHRRLSLGGGTVSWATRR